MVVNYTKNVLYDLFPRASTIKLFECDVGWNPTSEWAPLAQASVVSSLSKAPAQLLLWCDQIHS